MSNVIKRYHEHIGQNKPNKITITNIDLPKGNANTTDTSAPLTGKDYFNYSPPIVESLIWALGNFASNSAPINPIYGQTWYDTSEKVLKIFTGADHDNTPENWSAIETQALTSLPEIIPDYDKLYNVGSETKRWDNLYCENLNAISTLSIDGVALNSLIPVDTSQIVNSSNVPGVTVKDALSYLNGLEIGNDISGIENIYQKSGGATSITPQNIRYRVHSDDDITITINSSLPSPVLFQIVLIGMGRMTILAGPGVILTTIKSGSYCSFANFTKQDNDTWLVHGNFG